MWFGPSQMMETRMGSRMHAVNGHAAPAAAYSPAQIANIQKLVKHLRIL